MRNNLIEEESTLYRSGHSDRQMKTNFVFIVGVSRSGTSLIRRVLNRSDQIAISSESHFLGHVIGSEGVRQKIRRFGELSNDDTVRNLVDFIYSGELKNSSKFRGISRQWRWITARIDREAFLQKILASDRSDRAIFTIVLQLYSEYKGKPIAGDKTPVHLRYIPTLLEWFPDARIIHMLRDPRAVFVSELRRRKKNPASAPYRQLVHFPNIFKLFILLQTSVVWFESVWRYSNRYKKQFLNNYYLLRFEDLVREPEKNIRQVCDFLGVEFQDKMLHQSVVSEGFRFGQSGFDASAADRWREHIDPWINNWFIFWFRRYLKVFGYLD